MGTQGRVYIRSSSFTNINQKKHSESIMSKPDFSGSYVLDRSENFEEFMKKNGLGFMFRKIANKTKPSIEVIQEADSITWKTISTFFSSSTTFVFRRGDGRETS